MALSGPLEKMMEYWRALPRHSGSLIPDRHAFHPKHLTEILPRVSLLKRLDEDQLVFGVVGTGLDEFWEHPVTGINAYDLAAPRMQENLTMFCHAILDQPSGAYLTETVDDNQGREGRINSLYLPMNDRDGTPNYILGCTFADDPSSRVPLTDRFILDQKKVQGLEFLDLGCGTPTVDFIIETKRKTAIHPPRAHWWDRLLPGGPQKRSGMRHH